jgi:DNA-3-methyladenine glycosylase II
MTAIVITPRGPFSLAASMRFLEGFTPAAYRGASDGRVLRLAFPADDGPSTVSAEIGQAQGSEGAVQANVTVHTGNPSGPVHGWSPTGSRTRRPEVCWSTHPASRS